MYVNYLSPELYNISELTGVLAEFSGLCWLFGCYMYEKLNYPIGLVESSWGGTPVEAWSSTRALKECGLVPSEDMYELKEDIIQQTEKYVSILFKTL